MSLEAWLVLMAAQPKAMCYTHDNQYHVLICDQGKNDRLASIRREQKLLEITNNVWLFFWCFGFSKKLKIKNK